MADPDMEAKVVDPCCRDPKKCYASYENRNPLMRPCTNRYTAYSFKNVKSIKADASVTDRAGEPS